MLKIVRNISNLRKQILELRQEGLNIGLVPTMGALHSGHMALVSESLKTCDRTIVTLFINPKQFSDGEDFEVYPRNEQKDAAKLETNGAHLLFIPKIGESKFAKIQQNKIFGDFTGFTKIQKSKINPLF